MPNTQLQTLRRKRSNFKGQLSRFDTFVKNFKGDYAQLKIRLEQCQKLWYDFDEFQVQIEMLEGDTEDGTNSEDRAAFEDAYYDVVSKANNILEADISNQTAAQSTQNVGASSIPSVRFPKIDLPIFTGNYEEYMTFHDSFKALINDNPILTNIERFHYLRSSLKGDAAQVISGIETTSTNYQVAWQLLNDRYDNRRLIIHNHVRAIFELSSLSKESHIGLRQLFDNLNKHLRALESLKEPVKEWDTLLIYLICSKLDSTTRREWETASESLTTPTMKDFTDFLNKRYNLLQAISYKKHDAKPSPPQFAKNYKNDNNNKTQNYLCLKACVLCKQAHKISICDKFLSLSPKTRYLEVKTHKLCANCLGGGHSYQECTVDNNCKICNKKHHLLLHFNNSKKSGEQSIQDDTDQNKSVTVHTTFKDNQVLLSTAIVFICDSSGKQHKCKVLLDSGSQSNFITKELCERLKLPKQKINIPISGLGQACTNVSHKIQTTIKSVHNNFKANLSFLVVNQITDNLPINHIDFLKIQIPNNINLADPLCNVPSEIDALLGACIFWNLLCIGQIKLSNTQIMAQKTKLGWILSGQVANICNNPSKTLCHLSLDLNLQKQLERFWQVEHCEPRPMWSSEQKACEDNFISTHKREENGRFSVQLPLRHAISRLGESKQMAIKRFNSLERRLHNNTSLKAHYVDFMDEYRALGHMSEVDPDTPGLNYLPHTCVLKESSSTTKVRVVFDASAKTESGMSLNDILMTGPTIQQDLFSIVLRFRKHQYVITADCAKMYRQINIEGEQRHLQAVLWRSDERQPLKSFTLNTVTYGTSCAPFLAVRCLHQLAEENVFRKPYVSNIIKQDFYVDDLISGADTIEGALQIKREVTEILSQGHFELRKWRSNHAFIIQEEALTNEQLEFSENKESKTLGLVWNSQNDSFCYNLQVICVSPKYVTKRTILSFISKIFDPLGLIGPIIIKAKILLQQLWQLSLSWDESVPLQIYCSWKIYQEQIQSLENIAVPRCVITKNPIRIELHTFCDASETSYGACIYVRSVDTRGINCTNLLCAKSRVAPLKVISLPRLELCGALLAARLSTVAIKSLNLHMDQLYFWCDSSITLTWILDEPNKWKTFVGNRVSEIQELTDKRSWRHIRSEDNPADIISRGINPSELINSKLWWHGPKWLEKVVDEWPASMPIKISETPEGRITSKTMIATDPDLSLFLKFSSFLKLQRVVAYILRFKNNALKASPQTGPITPQELGLSVKCLLKLAQSHSFSEEKTSLKNIKCVSNKSKLKNLNPFLDNDGLLRLGGRLKRSNLDYDFKHPIILPKGHAMTKLLIIYEHRKLLHAGPQALLAHIRTRFWPIAGRNEVRKALKECVICFKVKPTTVDTLLGQLPEKRVNPSRPFLNCAVDYAGPFHIKVGLSRSKQLVKAYLCVFICLFTKALHLELVVDLSTNSFLNAFKRFISRRGKCQHIYSDNGTNFVGANHELTTFFNQTKNQDLFADFCAVENITWHFIPPRSPHFGGIWESAVKAVKYHLRRVIGNASLTYEEFNTIIVQVEACLNSRPLSPLSTDPDDLNPLTPGHFLIGSSLVAVPEPDLCDIKTGRLTRYQHLTQIMQHFWRRWSKDYLTEVQQRSCKGASSPNNLTIGTMVLLVDDNLPPLQWSLGRVVDVHPGLDGVVRVVTVKSTKGIFKRAVREVCVLPISD